MSTYSPNNKWQDKLANARIASRNGEHALAQKYYEEAIQCIERLMGADDIELCIPLMDLAECSKSVGNKNKAEQLYTRATYVLASYAKKKLRTALSDKHAS